MTRGATLLYTVIDTEGHEPVVIKGMRLDEEANQRYLRVIQLKMFSVRRAFAG